MLWILVAAINPHNPLSWGYTHTLDGTLRLVTEDTHNGAQVMPELLPDKIIWKLFKAGIWQMLFGIAPKRNTLTF